jgi:hypothetical protein
MAVGCTVATPPDGSFGPATFTVNGASRGPATAFAVPVYIYNNDTAADRGYDIVLVPAGDVPAGSPCGGSYRASTRARLELATSQRTGDRADLQERTLPVLANDDTSGDYAYFDTVSDPGDRVEFGSTTGTMTISAYDGSYIDATFEVTGQQFLDRYDGDIQTGPIEFAGTFHAGICAGGTP